MTNPDLPEDQTRVRAQLSALMDGESSAGDGDGADSVASVCRRWRDDADARAQWHRYHLIGDVLRSDDLGQRSAGDAAFLQAVRARLAQEPVVLAPTVAAPQPVAEPAMANGAAPHTLPPRRTPFHLRRWAAPVGMAAGVALVAGAVLVMRPGSVQDGPALAATAPRSDTLRAATDPRLSPADTELVRYLDAHQQFPGTPALGPAPGFLRSAAYEPQPSR
jgi:sigma-E factor negative regulatory protein RseA